MSTLIAFIAVIPGASKPERIREDHAALRAKIPAEFWRDLRKQGLVAPNAPLPIEGEASWPKYL